MPKAHAAFGEWQEGDIALVTTRSGKEYEAVYTLAPGIDFYWKPLDPAVRINSLADPDMLAELIERSGK